MSNLTTTIIFDLGGVLIDWNPRYVYRQLLDTETQVEQFLTEVCTHDWNEQQDAGRSITEANRILIEKFPEHQALIEAYYGRWTEMLGGPIPESVKILETLRKERKYRLFALTNWSAETFPEALQRYEFLQYFEDILVSGKVFLKKPDPAIYRMALARFGVAAENALFIDDSERNIAGSRGVGIPSIHFKSPQQLRSELEALGILTAPHPQPSWIKQKP